MTDANVEVPAKESSKGEGMGMHSLCVSAVAYREASVDRPACEGGVLVQRSPVLGTLQEEKKALLRMAEKAFEKKYVLKPNSGSVARDWSRLSKG